MQNKQKNWSGGPNIGKYMKYTKDMKYAEEKNT